MIDLYLIATDKVDMTDALIAAGIIDEKGFPVVGISLDHIGPFSRATNYDEANEPIIVNYPDWHTNLRGNFTEEQLAALELLRVQPTIPYRVWA
jgi:hypothetical protein